MKHKATQYILGTVLTLLLFSFATWGDFSWVTLTGPITLEPDLGNTERAGYIASPALQAVIIRLFFLLVCFFFCMIPNLVGALRQHARYLLALAAAVYAFFSYLLGTFVFFASNAPGASTLRIVVVDFFFILLVIGYDTSHQKFKSPSFLLKSSLLIPLVSLAIAVSIIVSVIFQGPVWLFNEQIYFVLLRMGIFLTALTGALAFHSWKHNT
mgnify:FL=1